MKNTLIAWYDGTKVVLYQVPTKELAAFDKSLFANCHGKMANSLIRELSEDDSETICYLAFLLGEEPFYGELPTLTDWLATQRRELNEESNFGNEVANINSQYDVGTLSGPQRQEALEMLSKKKQTGIKKAEKTYDPSFAKYKLADCKLTSCGSIVNTGWYI
jgi:hypothetical protein